MPRNYKLYLFNSQGSESLCRANKDELGLRKEQQARLIIHYQLSPCKDTVFPSHEEGLSFSKMKSIKSRIHKNKEGNA